MSIHPQDLERAFRLVWLMPDGTFSSPYNTADRHSRTMTARCLASVMTSPFYNAAEHVFGRPPVPSCTCGLYATFGPQPLAYHAWSMDARPFDMSPVRPDGAYAAVVLCDVTDAIPSHPSANEPRGTYRGSTLTYTGPLVVAGPISPEAASGITANYGIPASEQYANPKSSALNLLLAMGATLTDEFLETMSFIGAVRAHLRYGPQDPLPNNNREVHFLIDWAQWLRLEEQGRTIPPHIAEQIPADFRARFLAAEDYVDPDDDDMTFPVRRGLTSTDLIAYAAQEALRGSS